MLATCDVGLGKDRPAGGEDLWLTSERVLGYDHRDTLSSRKNLAGAYKSVGDVARAVSLYQDRAGDELRREIASVTPPI